MTTTEIDALFVGLPSRFSLEPYRNEPAVDVIDTSTWIAVRVPLSDYAAVRAALEGLFADGENGE